MVAIFELRGSDGTLQIDLASSLPQTLGVINMRDYTEPNGSFASGTVPIPGWVGKRHWFVYEGITAPTTIWCPYIYRTGDSLYFRISLQQQTQPRIKYGVY